MLYKILSKVFQLQITKYFLKQYFHYFCQLLWTSGPKYKIQNTFNEIQNTFRNHCESISQSINEYSINKQEKHKHISRLGIGTVTVTVQCTVKKRNTENTDWNIILRTRLNWIQPAEVLFQWQSILHKKCISITHNTFQLYFNYKHTNYFCQGHKIQNTLNVFKIHVFQLLVFQLLQHCSERCKIWKGGPSEDRVTCMCQM